MWYGLHINKEPTGSSVSYWYNESAHLNSAYRQLARHVVHTTGIQTHLSRNPKEGRECGKKIKLNLQPNCRVYQVPYSGSGRYAETFEGHVRRPEERQVLSKCSKARDELQYLMDVNQSISQVMAKTMQHVRFCLYFHSKHSTG